MTSHARSTSVDERNPDRLRIAILGSRGFPSTYGGYETFVRHVTRIWESQGHSVTVYCRTRPEPRRTPWVVEGARCIWTPGIDSKSLSTLTYGLTSHLDVSLRSVDVALVVNVANGFFLPLLKARGIPSVVNTDGLEWQRGKWGSFAQSVFFHGAKMAARFGDVLVSDSQSIADIWSEEFGVTPRYIAYGAPVLHDLPDDQVRALGVEPGKYALAVARITPENNVDLTLDAMRSLRDVKLVVVGSANYPNETERRLRGLSESGDIIWLGHVDNQDFLNELWAHAGVYVHGHSVGGTNPSLLQALGAGAPTLALDTMFNREVLDGDDKQIYSHDAAQLAAKIRELLSSPSRQSEFATKGRLIVSERFQWSQIAGKYEQALRDAISA